MLRSMASMLHAAADTLPGASPPVLMAVARPAALRHAAPLPWRKS